MNVQRVEGICTHIIRVLIQSLMYMRLKLYIVQYGIHKTHVAIKIFNQN